jgi:hypothetical protein
VTAGRSDGGGERLAGRSGLGRLVLADHDDHGR